MMQLFTLINTTTTGHEYLFVSDANQHYLIFLWIIFEKAESVIMFIEVY